MSACCCTATLLVGLFYISHTIRQRKPSPTQAANHLLAGSGFSITAAPLLHRSVRDPTLGRTASASTRRDGGSPPQNFQSGPGGSMNAQLCPDRGHHIPLEPHSRAEERAGRDRKHQQIQHRGYGFDTPTSSVGFGMWRDRCKWERSHVCVLTQGLVSLSNTRPPPKIRGIWSRKSMFAG